MAVHLCTMKDVQLGLKENRVQFGLLVLVNAFVGGMVGLERSILPLMAEEKFAIAAKTAILSFIIVFGLVKAVTNYVAGAGAHRIGRKKLLLAGWIIGIPVPFILMLAPSWNWIIAANILLGINQGLTWSTTVLMKIDLVGEKQRGFAMGLNEFAGYIAVAMVAFLTGWVAGRYGITPYPFYIGVVMVVAGFFLTLFFIKDTRHHIAMETAISNRPRLQNIFWQTTWKNKTLGSVTQAGLVNNLNDGMVWGLLPILLFAKGFTIKEIGIVAAVYPAVWGLGQLVTGKMADMFCKKRLLFAGMLLQAIALFLMVFAQSLVQFILLAVLLGWGTAMVYPTFLATIAEYTHPQDRSRCVGVFRLWRDGGYAIGAILTGLVADWFSTGTAVALTAMLTFISALVIWKRMHCAMEKSQPQATEIQHVLM